MIEKKEIKNIDCNIENVFNYPEMYIDLINKQKGLVKIDKKKYTGKSLVLVMFTSVCDVGCPFCCFKALSSATKKNIKNQFTPEGVNKFIEFANKANVGYLQISGGGEPFLEKEALLKSIEKINADRIILVTGGVWAYNREKAEKYLDEINQAIKKRKKKARISIRLSISQCHSIKLKHYPLENLINIFETKYRDNKNFTLQIKTFKDDPTLENNLKTMGRKFKIEKLQPNKSDDDKIIKIMPWKSKLILDSGFEIVIGISRVFYPSFRPNLHNNKSFMKMVELYDIDLDKSQNYFPSRAYNSKGYFGLDWLVEYNGNISTWQNSIQDDQLNIYEDNYKTSLNHTLANLITRSCIDNGSKYREKIVSEISPKTVMLMKANGIRDYASSILFADAKIRLYAYIRILQDYVKQGLVNEKLIENMPASIQKLIKSPKSVIKKYYLKSNTSILAQELSAEPDRDKYKDFLELVKLGHFEMSKQDIQTAVAYYNMFFPDKRIAKIEDFVNDNKNMDFRLRDRLSPMKKLKDLNNKVNNKKEIYIFRHGETNWNVGKYQGKPLSNFLNSHEGKEAITDYNKVVTDGESINQVRERLMYFLEKYVVNCPYERVAIITHGATMSNLKSEIDGEQYIDIDYCKIVYENKKFKLVESKISETDFAK